MTRQRKSEFHNQLSTEKEYIQSGSSYNSGAGSRAQRFGVEWRKDPASNLMDPTKIPF
jgi:hypothetical protein